MLIVDDSAFMRALIKKSVSELDVSIIGEADDGKAAVEKYIELKPDVVTLDLAMIEHDGIEALQKIMKHNPKAKVIIVSSTTDQDSVTEDVLRMGAFAVVNKPNIKGGIISAIKEIEALG